MRQQVEKRSQLRKSWRLIRKANRKRTILGYDSTLISPSIYCAVIEMELPDLGHGCSPECACLVKKETQR